jgi:hypothetical protein
MLVKLTVNEAQYIHIVRLEGDRTAEEAVPEAVAGLLERAMADLEDHTCDRLTRRGMCKRPLDKDGNCDRAGDHIQDEFSA